MPFACIFVPDFPVEALLRAEPELRSQAVAVLEGKAPLQKVLAGNEKARRAGVEVGMTKLQIEACTDFVLRARSLLQEAAAHSALLDCAQSFSPRIEDAGVQSAWHGSTARCCSQRTSGAGGRPPATTGPGQHFAHAGSSRAASDLRRSHRVGISADAFGTAGISAEPAIGATVCASRSARSGNARIATAAGVGKRMACGR